MSDADPLAWLASLEGVPSAFAATRDGIDALLRDRGRRRTVPEQTTESLLRGAYASAALAGSVSSLEEIRSGDGDPTAQSALRVSTSVLSLVPVLATSPAQVFARLHSLAGKGALDDSLLGRPANSEAAARLATLSRTLLATSMPALMVAAVLHAEVATAALFGSYDAIVARALERLTLVARGVDPASVVVPEAGHLALRPAYESNLRAYSTGGRPGVQAWLLYSAEAYTRAAEASPLRT
ncbi:MAG: oxidoreductase [Actinomycetota bacterium]|nr:oxidoreductase [Actinomycetota bacterium]